MPAASFLRFDGTILPRKESGVNPSRKCAPLPPSTVVTADEMTGQAPEIHLERLWYFDSRFKSRTRGSEELESANPELVLDLRFEGLWGELGRVSSMDAANMPYGIDPGHARSLARTGAYVSGRLHDAVVRWFLVRRLHRELSNASEGSTWMRRAFADLSVKDAHTDIGSLMDAVAFFLVRLDGDDEVDSLNWKPGFGQLRVQDGGRSSSWRKKLSPVSRQVVDEAESWFCFVRKIRDLLVHKPHFRVIFGAPFEVLAFQISSREDGPLITAEPLLLRPAGGPIVDFGRYVVWMLGELVYFIDRVAAVAMDRFGMAESDLGSGGRVAGAPVELRSELQRFIEKVASVS